MDLKRMPAQELADRLAAAAVEADGEESDTVDSLKAALLSRMKGEDTERHLQLLQGVVDNALEYEACMACQKAVTKAAGETWVDRLQHATA